MKHLRRNVSGVRIVRTQYILSSLAFAAITALSVLLVRLNWDTPQQAVATAVAISATSTALAAATDIRFLKVIAAVTLGVMIAVALTHPSGLLGVWVVVSVLFFVFAVVQPHLLRKRRSQN